MSSQKRDEGVISFSPSEEITDWLTEEAARRGDSPGEMCRRLVTAAHEATDDDGFEPAAREDFAALQGELEAQHQEFTDLIEDVRSRVIQVKRETDSKASADHDHPEIPSEAEWQAIEKDIATLETTVERGFENFETVLDDLVDETDDLAHRSTVLAQAVVRLRDWQAELAEQHRRQEAADRLQVAANQLQIRTAVCEDCDSSVDIALLTAPECPHCGSEFVEVVERSSLFGSHRLVTGEPPALEGNGERATDATADGVFEAIEGDADGTASDQYSSNRSTDDGGTD
ncbi:zinc-ribbon domain-containing protein [Natrinema halophilum]|uniref:CopG family transcriptional regulator n=1 Tax=Natrinema halophilum TaxID=1699371 RepID=A0A7D5H1I4_9EURY|nr:zinc-ribbon domain-containing protein [Natrinema halophilum]QLG48311.1 zinc-ribbon domain-containing protein [Natrinema halophilum]